MDAGAHCTPLRHSYFRARSAPAGDAKGSQDLVTPRSSQGWALWPATKDGPKLRSLAALSGLDPPGDRGPGDYGVITRPW
jgi:hypothetical protein